MQDAREGLEGTAGHMQAWDEQRPRLAGRLAEAFEGLWKARLDLRPRFRFRRRLPAPPRRHIGGGLRRLRRKSFKAYRKGLARLGSVATASRPARSRRFTINWLRFRIWLTPLKALVMLTLAGILALLLFAPEILELWL